MYHLTVPTDRIKGKQRQRFGNGRAYTPKATRDEEELIARCWRYRFGETLLEGPVAVSITVHAPAPKGWSKALLGSPWTVKPDADNVAKLCLDALNGVAWRDDAQVVRLRVEKAPRVSKAERCRYEIEVEA